MVTELLKDNVPKDEDEQSRHEKTIGVSTRAKDGSQERVRGIGTLMKIKISLTKLYNLLSITHR